MGVKLGTEEGTEVGATTMAWETEGPLLRAKLHPIGATTRVWDPKN